jgi:hypothetical protein
LARGRVKVREVLTNFRNYRKFVKALLPLGSERPGAAACTERHS